MYAKSFQPKTGDIERKWHTIDAGGQVLGRLATRIATLLQGKHKPIYARHADVGDFVIVTNAGKLRVTGKKLEQKVYFRHSGYSGGDKYETLGKMMSDNPERVLELAVSGMLPKNKLRANYMKRLKICDGAEQPHVSQKPEPVKI
jgi:large subunit ribosomal protein L13